MTDRRLILALGRLERAIVDEYEAAVSAKLGSMEYDRLVEIAGSPSLVKGYGPVKERNIARWREHLADLLGPGEAP